MAGATWDFTALFQGPIPGSGSSGLIVTSSVAGQNLTVTGWSSNTQVGLFGSSKGLGLVGGDGSGEIYPGGLLKIDLTALSSATLGTRTISYKGVAPTGQTLWAGIDPTGSSLGGGLRLSMGTAANGVTHTLY
jgi:hypothetical protein